MLSMRHTLYSTATHIKLRLKDCSRARILVDIIQYMMYHRRSPLATNVSLPSVHLSLTWSHAHQQKKTTSDAAILLIHGLQACGDFGKSGPLVGQRLPAVADERRQRWRRVARDVRPQAPMHDRQRCLNPADARVRHLRAHARITPTAC